MRLRRGSVGYLYKWTPAVGWYPEKTALNQIQGVLVRNLLYIWGW